MKFIEFMTFAQNADPYEIDPVTKKVKGKPWLKLSVNLDDIVSFSETLDQKENRATVVIEHIGPQLVKESVDSVAARIAEALASPDNVWIPAPNRNEPPGDEVTDKEANLIAFPGGLN